ncbi:amidase [Novosphingobium tardum]|uniref:Amidase n=1 Tax=Novosphingobium tardum TaxID=1538021 RepID=A0ABV8RPN0_9SPHN
MSRAKADTVKAFAGIDDAASALRSGAISSVELTGLMLDRIDLLDRHTRSYVHVCAERAIEQAKRCDRERARGLYRGPLHGVPVAVKDLCNTTFAPTAAGTVAYAGFMAPRNAAVVDRLEEAGAIILGKLAMTEGAFSLHHPDIPAPVNPWNQDYWTGVSSSGSGVATAAGLCFGAIGSDTGGSIRFPCAANNLSGIKPTWGRVSRRGTFALAETLDHIGPMARSVIDCAAMLGVIAGFDPEDPTSLTAPVPDYLASCVDNLDGVRIGIDRDYAFATADPEVAAALEAAIEVFQDLGAQFVGVTVPPSADLAASWTELCGAEAALVHHDRFAERPDDFGRALRFLLEGAAETSPITIARGFQRRYEFSSALKAMFDHVDAMLIPTMPMRIPTLEELAQRVPDMAWTGELLRFTAPFDFSGSPTVTLPNGVDTSGMPLSMQIAGPRMSEAMLIKIAHAYQARTHWHLRHPMLTGERA